MKFGYAWGDADDEDLDGQLATLTAPVSGPVTGHAADLAGACEPRGAPATTRCLAVSRIDPRIERANGRPRRLNLSKE
jgi:hypothetical protein